MIVKGDDGLVIIDTGMTIGADREDAVRVPKDHGLARQSDHLHAWAWNHTGRMDHVTVLKR